jgi:ATP-dependent helicase YprA (DUF1998 family)
MGYDLVKNCNCKSGCPSCVGASNVSSIIYRDFDGKGGWFYPDKMATKILLEMIL